MRYLLNASRIAMTTIQMAVNVRPLAMSAAEMASGPG